MFSIQMGTQYPRFTIKAPKINTLLQFIYSSIIKHVYDEMSYFSSLAATFKTLEVRFDYVVFYDTNTEAIAAKHLAL